ERTWKRLYRSGVTPRKRGNNHSEVASLQPTSGGESRHSFEVARVARDGSFVTANRAAEDWWRQGSRLMIWGSCISSCLPEKPNSPTPLLYATSKDERDLLRQMPSAKNRPNGGETMPPCVRAPAFGTLDRAFGIADTPDAVTRSA